MVCATREAEIGAGIDSKLSAEPSVRRDVIVVVNLPKGGVARQRAHALNGTHFEKYSPGCEINVEKIKRPKLWAQAKKARVVQYTRTVTDRETMVSVRRVLYGP